MTGIPFQDGKVVFRDGLVGSGEECCCEPPCPCTGCTLDTPADAAADGFGDATWDGQPVANTFPTCTDNNYCESFVEDDEAGTIARTKTCLSGSPVGSDRRRFAEEPADLIDEIPWNDGYPQAFSLPSSCPVGWVLVSAECESLGLETSFGFLPHGNYKWEWRLYQYDCESQSLVDITEEAVANADALKGEYWTGGISVVDGVASDILGEERCQPPEFCAFDLTLYCENEFP